MGSDLTLENGESIKNNDEITYLGVMITKDGCHETEILNRNRKSRFVISTLNSILWIKI